MQLLCAVWLAGDRHTRHQTSPARLVRQPPTYCCCVCLLFLSCTVCCFTCPSHRPCTSQQQQQQLHQPAPPAAAQLWCSRCRCTTRGPVPAAAAACACRPAPVEQQQQPRVTTGQSPPTRSTCWWWGPLATSASELGVVDRAMCAVFDSARRHGVTWVLRNLESVQAQARRT